MKRDEVSVAKIAGGVKPTCDEGINATSILTASDTGSPTAAEELINLVYGELHRLASWKMANEAPGHTLQPTALVNEAWLRLVGDKPAHFENRSHFFCAAAEAMRRILIDRARRRKTERHGGGYQRVTFEEEYLLKDPNDDGNLLLINSALENLTRKYPLHAQIVKLRYFAGMTNEEISQAMNVSTSTIKKYWSFSKAWLFQEIQKM